jgi:hypothetical protein
MLVGLAGALAALAVGVGLLIAEPGSRERTDTAAPPIQRASGPAPLTVRAALNAHPLPLPKKHPNASCSLFFAVPLDEPERPLDTSCSRANIAQINAKALARSLDPSTRPMLLARLPLRGGGVLLYGRFRTRAGGECGFQYGPTGYRGQRISQPADCFSGPDACAGVCLDLGGRTQRDGTIDYWTVGLLPAEADALRLTFADRSVRTIPATGPVLSDPPGRRVFLAEIGPHPPTLEEALRGGRVLASLRLRSPSAPVAAPRRPPRPPAPPPAVRP